MSKKIIVDIISAICIFLFVYAAISKLLDIQNFQIQIGQSPILTTYAKPLTWAIPGIEFLIAALLVIPRTRLAGLYSFFGLMIMFTTYIILASRFSDYVPCSCGGVIQGLNWTEHLIFNIVFLVLGVTAILLYSGHEHQTTSRYRRDAYHVPNT